MNEKIQKMWSVVHQRVVDGSQNQFVIITSYRLIYKTY